MAVRMRVVWLCWDGNEHGHRWSVFRRCPWVVGCAVCLSSAGLAGCPRLELLEEVVALVVYEDEGGEVFHGDFPDGFHAQLGVFHALDRFDGAL